MIDKIHSVKPVCVVTSGCTVDGDIVLINPKSDFTHVYYVPGGSTDMTIKNSVVVYRMTFKVGLFIGLMYFWFIVCLGEDYKIVMRRGAKK